MGGVDKLDELVLERPLLRWSVEAMAAAESVSRVIVVARPERVDELAQADWLHDVKVVAGGERRSDSVRAGVDAARADVVLIHDGARPLASAGLVDAVAAAAAQHGAAVPVLPVADSLKRGAGEFLGPSVEREGLVRTQTPQAARRSLLVEAFERAGATAYTDEAALLEAAGFAVATVPGETTNIKVTTQEDLELVRALARGRADERVGFGQDSHPFGPADGLWLGGVLIEDAPRLYGHSDGDVALHALATAVLAACGLGDLGQMFPSSEPDNAGAASSRLLQDVIQRTAAAGWRISRAQVALLGARPKLGSRWLQEMRARIADLLGLSVDQVAITASTGNLSGPEGAGRVISATALIGVHRR